MPQSAKEYENKIDSFVYYKYPKETPAYQAIVRERVLDLCARNVAPDSAAVYLKSGGWNPGFAVDYQEFLQYCDNVEEDNTVDTKEPMFTKKQVQKLLEQLVFEFAECAGYREFQDGEDIKEYRRDLMEFIKSGSNSMSAVGKAQLKEYLEQIKEMSSAMLSYIQQLG